MSYKFIEVTDISALKGMPLEFLDIRGTQVTDISVLKGLPLKYLYLPNTAKNIEILRSVKTLKSINGKDVADFWGKHDKKLILKEDYQK
ncbi:MAG: leucine-rich repeat domain-containing protein [Lentisphaeria bacterium]|nr:leucine-rich repeat domain-containing protein [Lentisphaeria bacterium]